MSSREPLLLDGEKEDVLGLDEDDFRHAEPLHSRIGSGGDMLGAGEHFNVEMPPDLLFADEPTQWDAVPAVNLDKFLRRVYDYYLEKGFACILVSRFVFVVKVDYSLS